MAIPSLTGSPYYVNGNIAYINKNNITNNPDEENKKAQHQEEINSSVQEHGRKNSDGFTFEDEKIRKAREEQQKAIISRDATRKAATINISQILRDFKNTGIAIGAPEEIMEDVETYINLIEKQVKKENPDKDIVHSNLKNGATLLDKYISETLQKPSKVVENWVEAILLQQVNYSYDENQVNEQLAVKFPNSKKEEKEEVISEENKETTQTSDNTKTKTTTYVVPQDTQLKNMFLKAKKMSFAKDYKTAMETFKTALDRAVEIKDTETESKILYEIGNIYDKNDYLAQALTSYNHSIKKTTDLNVKAKAHYSMAQIYDDVYQYESAIDHYISTISYAGETENVAVQSTSLAKIGKIYTDRYDKQAFNYLTIAEDLIQDTTNHKAIAFVNSNLGEAHSRFNQPKQALKHFSTAVLEYDKADSSDKVAINYKKAADIMQNLNNIPKAKKLLQKALFKARQTEDVQLMKEINDNLEKLA
jgi:tetratricopeptide (TPR) repeat protein